MAYTTLADNLDVDPDLKKLILGIADVTKEISAGFFEEDRGYADTENVFGEKQAR